MMRALGWCKWEQEDITGAVKWLYKAVKTGNTEAAHDLWEFFQTSQPFPDIQAPIGNNLAYMLRRGEVPPDIKLTAVAELLAPGLKAQAPLALINYALCLAKGFECQMDWEAADRIVATVKGTLPDFDWFCQLAQKGDAEGHLVIGWLARHKIIEDPDGYTVKKRMNLARQGGWVIPAWMDKKTK